MEILMPKGNLTKALDRSGGSYDVFGKPLPKNYKKGDYRTYPQAKFTPEGKKSDKGIMHFYDPKTGEPVMSGKVTIPKKFKDMTLWEKHLNLSGGKSKHFKNEKEFMDYTKKHSKKHK